MVFTRMSQQDLQFIERALAHPWMFWVYFWKWPRIVRQACAEYDLIAKELDTAKASHEQAVRANEKVAQWIKVTHQLDMTADLRAIWTAGKRLSILLVFFVVTNAFGQAPPYQRNQWTTNANPLALKVISTNGVHAATNIWELDFTNTATVTVSAVSNANKVMVSFTGSGGGGDSLWTNVASGSAVLGDILTPIEQYGIFQLATNRLGFWGEETTVLSIGYPPVDIDQLGTNVPILFLIGDYTGVGARFTNDCYVFFGIGEQVFQNMVADNAKLVVAIGEVAMGSSVRLTDVSGVLAVGNHALYSVDLNDCQYVVGVGHAVLENSAATNCDYLQMEGIASGQLSSFHSCQKVFGLGLFAMTDAVLTNCGQIMAIGSESAMLSAKLTNCLDIVAMGFRAGTNLVLTAKTNIMIFGNILNATPDSREFWFGNTNNVYRMPGNIGTIRGVSGYSWPTAHAAGVWTNDGAGVTGWKPLSDFGGGSGIATNDGTGWNTTFVTQTNHSQIVFTNGSKIGATAINTLTLTNSHLLFSADNTWDIGASDALRPRRGYFGGIIARGLTVGTGLTLASTDDQIRLYNGATQLKHLLLGSGYDLASDVPIYWRDNVDLAAGSRDLSLVRNAAGVIEVNSGTAGVRRDLLARTVTATNLVLQGATVNRVAIINANNNITNSAAVDTTELETLDGVTSAIQTQLNGKQVGSEVLTNLTATRAVTNMTVTTITNVGVSLYTVPSGCAYIFVECIGGGGGGGGVDGATSQSAAGGGGGSGAYCATNISTPAASYIVTVGTNGLGGAAGNNNGTIGGTTTFTNILTALGGSGGSGDASAAGVGFAVGGAGALQTATGRVYTGGNPGHNGICVSSALAVSGGGAGSHFGGGGAPQTADVGQNATGKGAGGSGAAVITNADRAGGNGSPGIIVIREFYQ